MIEVLPYAEANRAMWNDFNAEARNGHFQFARGYMEYHADRFSDASCMVFQNGSLIALFPANVVEDTIYSHQGLTFGGLVLGSEATSTQVLRIFDALLSHYRSRRIRRILYKALPFIYHQRPTQEDLYALFRSGAQLIRRDVTTTIDFRMPRSYSKRRQRGIRKAINAGTSFERSDQWNGYWELLSDTLMGRHGVRPVHTVDEMRMLASHFPESIQLFVARLNGDLIAGVVMYNTATVAHAQYIAANEMGRQIGALDGLFSFLIDEHQATHRFFDFGISNEDGGRVLNEGLVSQKEEFGGSSVVHEVYELLL